MTRSFSMDDALEDAVEPEDFSLNSVLSKQPFPVPEEKRFEL